MGKNTSKAAPTLGVKKNASKDVQKNAKNKQALQKSLGKQSGSFLKQRMGKKVKELQEDEDSSDEELCADVNGSAVSDIASLQAEAARRAAEFEQDVGATSSTAEVGVTSEASFNRGTDAENTRKQFWKELRKVLGAADIIIEVLDARDPAACRSLELEREVSAAGKRLVLLINKIDLVPKHAVEAWVNHLKRSFPVIAFKAAQSGTRRPVHANTSVANAPEGLLNSTHAVVGADEVMQLLKNYSRQGGTKNKSHVTVGVVGYPNTGKSSVINSMKRHSSVEVGGRSGVTKVMQEIVLDSKITLIDSPGVVFEGASNDPSVVLRNVVRVENVEDPGGVVEAMMKKAPRDAVISFYGLTCDFQTIDDFLIHVAQTRGKRKRNNRGQAGGLDLESAARCVITDWTTGKFRYFVMPPAASAGDAARAEEEVSQVVSSLAPALDIDALIGGRGAMPAILGKALPRPQSGGDADMDCGEPDTVEIDMDLIP